MTDFPYTRKNLRLRERRYYEPGFYYVTLCTWRKLHLFGKYTAKKVVLNDYGHIAKDEWRRSGLIRREISLDSFIVLPSHMHCLIKIEEPSNVGANGVRPSKSQNNQGLFPCSIGSLIAGYKSIVTKRINQLRETPGGRVWQRGYNDRIIRKFDRLVEIRKYIDTNQEIHLKRISGE